jgi:predicted RND superfamily exporter protein
VSYSPIDALARALLRGPTRSLLVAAAVTAVLAPGLVRLRFEGNLLELLPDGARSARALSHYVRTFGKNDPVAVLVTGGGSPELTSFAERFARASAKVPNVISVERRVALGGGDEDRSAVASVFPLLDEEGFARARELLAPAAIDESVRRARAVLLQPGGREAAATITRDPLELRRLLVPVGSRLAAGLSVDPATGDFLAPDGEALVMLVRTRADAFDGRSARALLAGLERAAARSKPRALQVRMTGAHAVAVATERMIRDDLRRSSLASLGLVLLVFTVAFGRLRALAAVGPPLVLGALWTAGLAGWLFGSLNAISVAFAAILVGLGDDLATHLTLAIDTRARAGLPARTAAAEGLRALARPTIVAATTGALGFLALWRSSFPAIRDLGLLAAAGILLTGLAVLLVTPAMTTLGSGRAAPAGLAPRRLDRALARWGEIVARRRALVLAAVGASVVAAVAVGPAPLAREVVAVRPKALEPLRVQEELFRRFGGEPGQIVALVRGRSLQDALERSDAIADALGRLSRAGLVAGWSSLSTLHPAARTVARRIVQRDALGLPAAAETLEARLRAHGFRPDPFARALADLKSPPPAPPATEPARGSLLAERHLRRTSAGWEVATMVRPKRGADPRRVARALERAVPSVRAAGYPLLEAEVRALLPADLAQVGGVSLLLVLAGLALHFRRPGPALIAAGGVAVGLAWMCLAGRVLGVPWSAYNLLVVPVLIGISIDENVFLAHGVLAHPGPRGAAVARALGGSGRAVITTASTTAAGFGALTLCAFDGLRAIGATAALGIGACLLASLVVTPALLALGGDVRASR